MSSFVWRKNWLTKMLQPQSGTGMRHGRRSVDQAKEVPVSRNGSIVEAFPNGFLGVLMPEGELLSAPRLKRGRRFDWLYERMATSGRLESVLSKSLELPQEFWRCLSTETDHELRAELICLLTAALAAQGTA